MAGAYIKKGRRKGPAMRDVSPKSHEETEKLLEAQDEVKDFIKDSFTRFRREFMNFVSDVYTSIGNQKTKDHNRFERLIYDLEENVRVLRHRLEELEERKEKGQGTERRQATPSPTCTRAAPYHEVAA